MLNLDLNSLEQSAHKYCNSSGEIYLLNFNDVIHAYQKYFRKVVGT